MPHTRTAVENLKIALEIKRKKEALQKEFWSLFSGMTPAERLRRKIAARKATVNPAPAPQKEIEPYADEIAVLMAAFKSLAIDSGAFLPNRSARFARLAVEHIKIESHRQMFKISEVENGIVITRVRG